MICIHGRTKQATWKFANEFVVIHITDITVILALISDWLVKINIKFKLRN